MDVHVSACFDFQLQFWRWMETRLDVNEFVLLILHVYIILSYRIMWGFMVFLLYNGNLKFWLLSLVSGEQ